MKNLGELYRLFFEEAGDALIAVTLPDGLVFAMNQAFAALTGYSREELEGESLAILAPSAGGDEARARLLGPQMLQQPGFYNDVALATRDGLFRYVTVKVRHVPLQGKTLALAVLSDDTERQLLVRDLATKHLSLETAYLELESMHNALKTTQEKMIQASKLMALGELAAGMSHELNQPLTGIRGFAQEIEDILNSDPRPKKSVVRRLSRLIVQNADKAAGLLAHLRDFARKERRNFEQEPRRPEGVDVQKSIGSVSALLHRQLEKASVRLELKGLEKLPPVASQRHAFEQVLVNLITNSRDAILDRAQATGRAGGHIRVAGRVRGGLVEISVSDDGGGIPAAARDKIFDPFYTTKEPGKGLGLGLSISYGIAHEFGGELALEASSPSGTSFIYRLRPFEETQTAPPRREVA